MDSVKINLSIADGLRYAFNRIHSYWQSGIPSRGFDILIQRRISAVATSNSSVLRHYALYLNCWYHCAIYYGIGLLVLKNILS